MGRAGQDRAGSVNLFRHEVSCKIPSPKRPLVLIRSSRACSLCKPPPHRGPSVGTDLLRAVDIPGTCWLGVEQSRVSRKLSLRVQKLNWSRISGKAAARAARNAGVLGVLPQYPLSCTTSRGSEQPKTAMATARCAAAEPAAA